MITFEYKNIELSCHKNMYGQTNVVFGINADLIGTNEDGISKTKNISAALGKPGTPYIDISVITKDQAVAWIESNAANVIQQVKDELTADLETFKIVRIPD